MTHLYNAQLIVTIGTLLLVYMIIVPIIGAFKALVATLLGDSTPQEEGYLTLNPMVHASFFWVTLLVISQLIYSYMPFGFGQQITINENNFYGKWGRLKYWCALFSNSVMAFIISLGAFSTLLVMHGIKVAFLLHKQPTLKNLYALFPESSTLSLIITFLLLSGFVMASFTAALTIMLNLFHLVQPYLMQRISHKSGAIEFLIFMIPLLIFYFCIDPLYKIVIKSVIKLSYYLVIGAGLLVAR